MISNQILQSTIDGLKSITRKELSVVEKEGKVIATTEENIMAVRLMRWRILSVPLRRVS